jgi:hypothetical protein
VTESTFTGDPEHHQPYTTPGLVEYVHDSARDARVVPV